jgi:hypothetical protein
MQNQIPFSNYPQNFNRTMQIVEPTYSQHIMKAPELNVTNGRIPQVLVIDSNDRDCRKYFKPNDYTYQLNKEYKNVVSIELVQACIPYTGYAINENNNRLFIQETFGETVEVVIPIGNYTAQVLADIVYKALNDSPDLSSVYTIRPDLNLQKFTITSDLSGGDHIFRFLNNSCPCGQNAPNDEHNSFVNGHNVSCNDCDSCKLCHKNNCQEYIKGSISKKLGFGKVNYLFASGTITKIEMSKSIRIFACNSKFISEFMIGDRISFSELIGTTFTISNIVSDTEMIILPKDDGGGGGIEVPFGGESGPVKPGIGKKFEDIIMCSKIFANKYTSDSVWDLEDAKYIILDIDHLENIDSNNKNIDDSYAVIFFTTPHGEDNILSTGSTPRKGIKKYFNPPLSTLDRLRIKFITADGELYDFNGRNHVLMFEIIALNQPGKYSTLVTN